MNETTTTTPNRNEPIAPEYRNPTTATSQGVKLGVMRWVLGISIAAAVIALVASLAFA